MEHNEIDSISEAEMGIFQILERFNLSLKMIKVCSNSCGLLNPNTNSSSPTDLTSAQISCLQTCAFNFKSTYDTFYNKVKQKYLFGNHEQDQDNDDDDDDDEQHQQ